MVLILVQNLARSETGQAQTPVLCPREDNRRVVTTVEREHWCLVEEASVRLSTNRQKSIPLCWVPNFQCFVPGGCDQELSISREAPEGDRPIMAREDVKAQSFRVPHPTGAISTPCRQYVPSRMPMDPLDCCQNDLRRGLSEKYLNRVRRALELDQKFSVSLPQLDHSIHSSSC